MYTSLKIVKKLSFAWVYYPNDLLTGFVISKGYLTGDEVTGLVQIVEQGKTKRPEVLLSNITVIDEYTGGGPVSFSNFADFQQLLVLMGNPLMVDAVSGGSDINATNSFISKPGFDVLNNKITIKPNWIWKLSGVTYSNPVSSEITVQYCSPGKSRLEYIIPNASNGFTVISGIETDSIPFAPPIPDTALFVTFYTVTDNSIDNAQEPISGNTYIEKIENQDFLVNYTGTTSLEQVNLIDNRSSIVVTGAISEIKSFDILTQFIRPGKLFYIKNLTGNKLKLKKLSGSGNLKLSNDSYLQNNELAHLKLNSNDPENLTLEIVGLENKNKFQYDEFKFLQKGFGNYDLENYEIGDIFCGWSDDGMLRYPEAKWLGGPLNTSVSFNPLITIIIES